MPYQANPIMEGFCTIDEGMVRSFLLTGGDGALLVDTGACGENLRAFCETLTDRPITVLTTHADGDHTAAHKQFDRVYMHPADIDRYAKSGGDAGALLPMREGDMFTAGAFTLPTVPAGVIYRVLATADAYHEKETVIAVSVGEAADAGRLALSRALGALRGTVVDRHGKPVTDARITVTHASGVLYNAVTDAEGRYLIESIPSGDYTVLSVKDGLLDGEVSGVSVISGQTVDAAGIVQPEPVALVNPGFETQGEQYTDAEGWNIACTRSDVNGPACFRQDRTYFGGAKEGVFGLGIWLDQAFAADASQRVTNLVAGRYVLDAYVYSGVTGRFTMYVKDTDGAIIAERAIGLSSGHVLQSLPFELAAGGDIVIGFAVDTIGGDWAVVDQVTLGAY